MKRITFSQITKSVKESLIGLLILGILGSLIAAWMIEGFPFPSQERERVEGVIVLNDFGEYSEKYGVHFDVPPKLQFLSEHGGVYTGGTIDVLSNENDGFYYEIVRGFPVGTKVIWVATGVVSGD